MNIHWWGIGAGVIGITSGTIKILTGEDGIYWGFPVSAWTGYIYLPFGIFAFVLSARALWRGEGKRKKRVYSDEEIERAKAELDQMYKKEHGKLPEKPKPGQDDLW